MKWTLSVLALAGSVSGTALAADGGPYAAVDIGRSRFTDACKTVPATLTCKDTDATVRFAGGYDFSQMWEIFTPGVEVGVANLGKAEFTGGSFKATSVQIEGTGSFALGDSFSIIAKLGFVQAFSKLDSGVQGFGTPGASSNRTNGACAVGVQYDFNRQFGVRAQYENLRTFGSSDAAGRAKVKLVSVGLVYRP